MELLKLALSLEEDLKTYYREQAALNSENSLSKVFHLLAKEEEKHVEILQSYAEKMELPLTDSNILLEVQSIFKEMKDFKSEINKYPSQLEVYRMALLKEEQSLNFYKDLYSKASEEQSKDVFRYLIKQEDTHCVILEELVKRVNRPEEWVEDAEFGIREDY
jgi:rubrerythrin